MHMGGLSIECRNIDRHYEIELKGELDLATLEDLEAEIRRAETELEHSEALDGVVIDTTALEFIDSTGVGALVDARKRIGDRLKLVPGDTTRRILAITSTNKFFGLDS